ncbi:uncharacterized protein EDB91DRAFT_1342980 [Suillus paluster]|uniref:uncharacterized protein n=1 Tax=Suillus paluster TaxID=48578 RepID=UPI001B87B622|nr:uncharacterized protein EDB91DRAFT_1342980 [Suillus paluster]KAG1753553.1 hypothetical protein EDB91DRAFT_1342980 [Suillus paluster]
MLDYAKALPFVLVLAAMRDPKYSAASGIVHPASCNLTAFPLSDSDSDTPHALPEDFSSSASATNEDNTTLDTSPSPPSSSYGIIELLIMLISQIAILAHQLLHISSVVDVLSSSFVTLEQATDLETTNLHAAMELVKQDLDSVKDQSHCHERKLAHETTKFASLVADQQRQIDYLSKQLHEERELSIDIKKNLEKLTSRISRGDKDLDAFHGRLHGQLARQVKDQLRAENDVADLRKELDAFHGRLHGQLICQVKDQMRMESDVADLRKDIPKTLSLYHTRISTLEVALSQAKPPASPQDVVCNSKPVRSVTFADTNPLPEQVRPNSHQNLPTPPSTLPKKQRSGISTFTPPFRFIDRESIYIQKSAPISSRAAGVPTKPTTPKTPTTVDSARRPVTVKSSVPKVLPSSKIAISVTKVSSAPKAGVLKTPASKGIGASSNNPARRESATLKKSGIATKAKVQEPRAPLEKSGNVVKGNVKEPSASLKKRAAAAKGKVLKPRTNQVLPPSSSPVTPATTSHAPDSTSRPDETSQGVASQALSSASSLDALDAAVQLHSLGDLRDPLPSLDSMSWLTGGLDGVASQPLSSSSSLDALNAAVQLHSLGDLRDPLPSLDSMSWLDEYHEIAGQPLCSLSSVEALDVAVQLLSLDDLRGPLPSLDSMSFLDDDAFPVPPFKSLGRDKTRSIKRQGVSGQTLPPMKVLDAAVQLSSLDDLCGTMPSLDSMSFLDDDSLPVPPFKSLARNKA